jgi:hypothetical protein
VEVPFRRPARPLAWPEATEFAEVSLNLGLAHTSEETSAGSTWSGDEVAARSKDLLAGKLQEGGRHSGSSG